MQDAKARQKEASAECKKLEKDMNDFKDNKDSKLKELKVCQTDDSDIEAV